MAKQDELLEYLMQGKGTRIPNVYKAIYGFELTYPGYAEKALKAMELTEPKNAREEYEKWVINYEKDHNAALKNVAKWYHNYLERRMEKTWKSQISKISTENLLILKESLKDEKQKNTQAKLNT